MFVNPNLSVGSVGSVSVSLPATATYQSATKSKYDPTLHTGSNYAKLRDNSMSAWAALQEPLARKPAPPDTNKVALLLVVVAGELEFLGNMAAGTLPHTRTPHTNMYTHHVCKMNEDM